MIVGCPSCGAHVEFKAGSSVAVVCGHCKFVVVRSDRDLRAVGRVAALADTDSPLYLGLRGTFRGIPYELVGRQQLDHGQGPWDEWYCAFADGRWGWLAEAQGRYYFTFAVAPPAIPWNYAVLGGPVEVAGYRYVVAEKGTGTFVAFEGELPVVSAPGETFGYVDLSGEGGTFGTLDYGQGSGAAPEAAYVGFVVPFPELGLPIDPNAKRLAALQSGGASGGATAEGTALSCPNCGGNLEIRAPGTTKRIACPYCSSLLDASRGPLKWLEVLEQQQTIPKIPIGARGRLDQLLREAVATGQGAPEWTVIGYMTRACNVDGVWYSWDEYLLYEQTRGFRFLLEQDGHWSVVVPVEAGAITVGQVFDDNAKWRGLNFRKFSKVDAVVTRVLGEFYWEVATGETSTATDFVHPAKGLVLSKELEGDEGRQEINWSVGHYVDPKALFAAFGVKTAPPPRRGIAPHQPNEAKASAKSLGLISLGLFVLWVIIFFVAVGSAKDKLVYEQEIELPLPSEEAVEPSDEPGSKAEKPEPAFFSEPFKIPVGSNVQAEVTTELQNTFLWVGMALVNEKTQEVFEMEVEPSFYAGVTDGESWSEGSKRQTATASGLSPGTYVLRLQPVGDTPDNCTRLGTMCPTSFRVRLKNDVPILWPGILALLLIVIVPIVALIRMIVFESKRWAESNTRSG
jgi:DNA-directed RNA polymerase subunit RPC12/RpoP